MHVLVVGGAGYIGSHCTRDLIDHGHTTVVFDNLSTGHREAVSSEFVQGDIRDRAALRALFSEHEFDAVMHFAAKSLVGESVSNPLRYYDVNVGGTVALLSEMQNSGVMNLIFSSTCAVYGAPEYLPLDEQHPKAPVSPYGLSKLMVEQILDAAREREGFNIAALRYFNAAGAHPDGSLGESHNPETHLIPIALEANMGQRGPLKLFGDDYETRDGTCIRDYVHIMDLAAAHRLAMEHLCAGKSSGGAWNLGTGTGTTVLEILQSIHRVTGEPVPYEKAERREGDPPGLYAKAIKAEHELGWTPEYTEVDEIVKHAWQWAKKPLF
jgi:UDP-glucose 4-epimerase